MERYRQTLYCDINFLKSIISKSEANYSGLDNLFNGETEIISNIRNLILSQDIKLYLNISHEEYDKLQSDINKKRLKAAKKGKEPDLSEFERLLLDLELKQQDNTTHLHINSKRIQFDDTMLQGNYLNAVFFSCEPKETCYQAMKDYGVIVFCVEMIDDFQQIIFDHGAAIKKGEESDWRKCLSSERVQVPCNSLIVVDNYILNETSEIEENLTPLFDMILPMTLKRSVTFELTVFTTLKNDRGIDYEIKGRFNKVMEILHNIRPDMKFLLSILKCSKDKFHDRNIASGNIFVGSGGGFNLFKNGRSQKTTTICAFYPLFYWHSNWSRKAYSDLLNEASAVFKKASVLENLDQQYCNSNYIFGIKQNRLLEQIE